MDVTSTFAGALRDVRHQLHLSQRELGDLFGVTGRTVARWEGGRCEIGAAQARLVVQTIAARDPERGRQLAQALGSSPEALGIAPRPTPTPVQQKESVERVFYAAAEALDISPKRLRGGLVTLLNGLHALGLDCAQAATALAGEPAE